VKKVNAIWDPSGDQAGSVAFQPSRGILAKGGITSGHGNDCGNVPRERLEEIIGVEDALLHRRHLRTHESPHTLLTRWTAPFGVSERSAPLGATLHPHCAFSLAYAASSVRIAAPKPDLTVTPSQQTFGRDGHHLVHWGRGGDTNLDNLVLRQYDPIESRRVRSASAGPPFGNITRAAACSEYGWLTGRQLSPCGTGPAALVSVPGICASGEPRSATGFVPGTGFTGCWVGTPEREAAAEE
jgi:hypothetical protein